MWNCRRALLPRAPECETVVELFSRDVQNVKLSSNFSPEMSRMWNCHRTLLPRAPAAPVGDWVGEWLRCESLEALYNSYGFIILCGKLYAIPMKTIFLTTVSGSEGCLKNVKKRPDPPRSKNMSKIYAKTYFSKLVPLSSTFLFLFLGTISVPKDLLGKIL